MGWFRSGKGEGVLGDGPADNAIEMLKKLAARCRRKPGLEFLLNAIHQALRYRLEAIASDPQPPIRSVQAFSSSGQTVTSSKDGKVEEDALKIVFQTFEDFAVEYQESELGRKPTVAELIGNVCFILAADSGRYLEMAGRGDVVLLTADREAG